jgi:hypothetical protein
MTARVDLESSRAATLMFVTRPRAEMSKRGRDAKLIDWLDELTAECPKKIAHNT